MSDSIWSDTEALELDVAPPSIEEIRLRCLELVLHYVSYGKPLVGDESSIAVREQVRELSRFFEKYVVNG